MTGGLRPHFADRLAALVEERRSRVVLGLDPDPAASVAAGGRPAGSRWAGGAAPRSQPDGRGGRSSTAAARSWRRARPASRSSHSSPASSGSAPPAGRRSSRWSAIAHDHGLLVIADGKRGDVPVTARAYAQALVGETPGPFGPVEGLGADAFTANPLLGRDALEPLLEAAATAGAGCFVLVRTSNPGAAELQDAGRAAPARAARRARRRARRRAARRVRAVRRRRGRPGATRPDHLERLRELMPHAIFLLPGVGAQGGRVEELGAGLRAAPGGGARDRLALDRERLQRARGRPGRRCGGRRRGASRRRCGALSDTAQVSAAAGEGRSR